MTNQARSLQRFERVWTELRRFEMRRGLAASLLIAAAGFALLAWSDYRFELARSARIVGLAGLALAVLAAVWLKVVVPLRWWTRARTAVEVEGRFPQLGQRPRTVLQYAGLDEAEIDARGITPGLVGALDEETEARVGPLPLSSVVPRAWVPILASAAAVPIALLALAASRSEEWRIAIRRSLLIETPYTTIVVRPGTRLVDQGADVPIEVTLSGRPRSKVILETRRAGRPEDPWKSRTLESPRAGSALDRDATLAKIRDSLDYRVVAGPSRSDVYRINVRYPLAIRELEATIRPPAYTGLEPSIAKGGDMQAVQGSEATLRVRFDAAPAVATLEFSEPSRKANPDGDAPPPTVLPLRRDGEDFVADLSLTRDLDYKIVARSEDARELPAKTHRIHVREDRAPRVAFEEPEEALEVHPVAEVLKRVRIGDDFGVTRAGIVFRFNDGEEQTLTSADLSTKAGEKPRTTATLEETLLMETLAASPRDSVTYYAFAEDNFPGSPRRTETDLRFIDIRPFKRDYKLADPDGGIPGEPDELATLEELIARQRFNLNRANRLSRRREKDKGFGEDPLKIAGFEEALLSMTREFTAGIENIVDAPVEALHSAEAAMLAAIEALDRGRNDEAPLAMSEAQKSLVAARRELFFMIGADPSAAMAMRNFDRKQAQKIRKPKDKDQEAEQIADEIEELAREEDFVYATIASADVRGSNNEAPEGKGGDQKTPEAEDAEADDPKNAPSKSGRSANLGSGGRGRGREGRGGEGATEIDRRALAEKQAEIADEARDLEERLKRIEAASDLAKARMARAAEAAERSRGALQRGNAEESSREARAGAGMLHELARQVKAEIAPEVADQVAMARDIAGEMARKAADIAARDGGGDGSEAPAGLDEAARTLEALLARIDQQGEVKAAEAVREIRDAQEIAEIVDRAERVRDLKIGGKIDESSREARDLAEDLERIGQALDALHRGLVAPHLARLADLDGRVAELTTRLTSISKDADISQWHRDAEALIRELEQSDIAGASELANALKDAGWDGGNTHWGWGGDRDHRDAPGPYLTRLSAISRVLKDQIQEMILRDVAASGDEATPPRYRVMVDRYYEVLSRSGTNR